ncbi:MAG: class I SAM-dependent methyltransferase [Candidatus Competibacteraceae bacterium]|nr:MAG: class I SAM-dependent methyltransferase [Candidatus Competibacteraceae bacterium]
MNASTVSRDQRIYANVGNLPLIDLLEGDVQRVLDIGCGAGDNAALIRARFPYAQISGVTVSPAEAEVARPLFDNCWLFDIEADLPPDLQQAQFDTLVFSHVLEHLREPALVLSRFMLLLQPGGQILIAVPNVLGWRQRIQFLAGRFEYESTGVLDDTHLRFFTYFTADRYLLADCPELQVIHKGATGSVLLWWLRRYVLPTSWSAAIDRLGCARWPNLFGGQVLIKAVKS